MGDKVILVGKTPPPIGGVTVHVKRLKYLLDKEGYNNCIVEYSKFSNLLKIFSFNRGIYHLHISNVYLRFILTLLLSLQNKKVINTFHSFRNKKKSSIAINKFTSKLSFKNIGVGKKLSEELIELGFNRIFFQEPFIPPSLDEMIGLKCDMKESNKFTIGINAYSILLENGKDIYGVMFTLEVIKKLVKERYTVFLNIYFSEIKNQEFYEMIIEFINENKLEDYVKMVQGKNLIKEFPNLNLFLRPTLTDSYGISVSEAIFLGVPAIASNVCIRDEHAQVYDIKNPEGLINEIKDKIERGNQVMPILKEFDSAKYLIDLYGFEA